MSVTTNDFSMMSLNEPSSRQVSNRHANVLNSTLSQLKMKEHMDKKRNFAKPPKHTDVSTSRLDSSTSRVKQFDPQGQQSVYDEDVRRLVESRFV